MAKRNKNRSKRNKSTELNTVTIETLVSHSKQSIKELNAINNRFLDLWDKLERELIYEQGNTFKDYFYDSFFQLENNLLTSIGLIGEITKSKLTLIK